MLILLALGFVAAFSLARAKDPFFDKVARAYYDFDQKGLRSFECNETCDMLDFLKKNFQMKFGNEDQRVQTFDSLSFKLSMTQDGKFDCEPVGFQPTQDADFDKRVHGAIEFVRDDTLKVLKLWRDFMIVGICNTDTQDVFKVKTLDSGYEVNATEAGRKAILLLDPQFKVTSISWNDWGTIKPQFTKTPNGFLLQSMKVYTPEENYKVLFHYENIKKFKMLDWFTIEFKFKDKFPKQLGINPMRYSFSNYRVNEN